MFEKQSAPFNAGEIEIQTRLGVHQQVMSYAPRVIRDFMPDQHREFFAQLPLLFIGSIDAEGNPWASAVFGRPGFTTSPDPQTLHIQAKPSFGDPLNDNLKLGASLGFLGLEHHSRRRNRLSGKIGRIDEQGFEIRVDQSFGNCPKYIHARSFEVTDHVDHQSASRPLHTGAVLNDRAKALIHQSRSFFIASYYQEDPSQANQGADMSHRGGLPGFVRIDGDDTLIYPEFAGNNHYNTMGNLHKNPVAGLLFMDFENGDLLYLTCTTEIIWDDPDLAAFDGAKQFIRLRVKQMVLVEGVMPLRWVSLEASANFIGTGSWEQVAAGKKAGSNSKWRDFVVTGVRDESSTIRSFELKPQVGEITPFLSGQFLPVRIPVNGWDKPETRSYSISNKADFYRLSIKRESGQDGNSPGLVSNYFHDHIRPGSVIQVGRPSGKFTLDLNTQRPVVLLSAGVGVTPMISMLEDMVGLWEQGSQRRVYFLHGARNRQQHAFADQVTELAHRYDQLRVGYYYSNPAATDYQSDGLRHVGRLDMDVLKRQLPFDDYNFYICGPAAFTEGFRNALRAMNIADERIHFEYFGSPSRGTKRAGKPAAAVSEPHRVAFSGSDKVLGWTPDQGSLLDLMETAGLERPFSCRMGSCHSCATRIVSGRVTYPDGQPEGLDANTALVCAAHPTGDEPLVLEV